MKKGFLCVLFFLGLGISPVFAQARMIPESQTWDNLDWWQRVTVSYESGSQTLSGRIGHGALQVIWFPATLGGMVGTEIAEEAGFYEGMGAPTMQEREIMAGIGIGGDIMAATGIYGAAKLPMTRAPGSLTVPEAAYVYGSRGIEKLRARVQQGEVGNALVRQLLREKEITVAQEQLSDTAFIMRASHGETPVGEFPFFKNLEGNMAEFGKMKVDPAYQGGGIYTAAMKKMFRANPELTAIKSVIQNRPTVNFMRGAQRLGMDMSRVFAESPLGRARARWGFNEHFVNNWRTTSIRGNPMTQFDVLSFQSGSSYGGYFPRQGLPGIANLGAGAVGGGFTGCQGIPCKPKN